MNNRNTLRYKDRLLSKREELTIRKSRIDSIPAGKLRGDPIDMAAHETVAATQFRVHHTDGKLLRAIEGALMRIQREDFGICTECGQSISKPRLEAVPWTKLCRDCKEQRDSGA
jgi:DnaK suppressor protein